MIHKICENILESLVKNLLLKKIFWKAFFEEVKFEKFSIMEEKLELERPKNN